MIHLFKVALPTSDMFVRSIDLKSKTIDYQVVEKDKANLLEPRKVSKLTITKDRIEFDNRFIGLHLLQLILEAFEDGV